MNPADKVRLKQLYLEETGEDIPETDLTDFILYVAAAMGREDYEGLIKDEEPDVPAITDYIAWLENRIIDLENGRLI